MNFDNPLLSQQQRNYQQRSSIFNNNSLLNNQQYQCMDNNHIQKMKEIQEIKRIEAFNKIEREYNKDTVKNLIIAPQKVDISITEKNINEQKYKNLDNEYNPKQKTHLHELKLHWKQRTNQPYKNIMKDKKYYEKFLQKDKLHQIKKDELIVHKVTNADKLGVVEDFESMEKNIEDHNKSLKEIYSASKELEHKHQFEYVHKNTNRLKYNPSEHIDKVEFYKKEQKRLEKDKLKKDLILDKLVNESEYDINEILEKKLPKTTPINKKLPSVKPQNTTNKLSDENIKTNNIKHEDRNTVDRPDRHARLEKQNIPKVKPKSKPIINKQSEQTNRIKQKERNIDRPNRQERLEKQKKI